MRISALLVLLLAAVPGGIMAQCNPTPAVQTAIDSLPTQSADETDWQFRQKHDAAIDALLKQFPGDFFVERTYIESKWRYDEKDKVIAEYKARHEKNPDDPVAGYLYAVALEGRQSRESIKLLDAALVKSPRFPWSHYGLAGIYGMPVFQNKEERLKHVKAFLDACPDSLDGYRLVTNIDDKEVLAAYAARLRTLLGTRTDTNAIRAWGTLWSIEFKAHPPSEYDGLRKQVADDLKRLRALNREDKRAWYSTLEQGYKLANDQKQADWAADERARRMPQPWELASMSKWFKDHPRPNSDDPAAKKRAYYADELKQADLWLKERPKMVEIWRSRLSAMEYMEDIPSAEVEATANTYLKLAAEDAGPDGPDS